MIKLKGIKKAYDIGKEKIEILNIDEFVIKDNDFLSVVGPSGSGKSTLLNILSLIDVESDGEVIYENKNILKFKDKDKVKFRRDNVGYVFQSFNLLPHLTALENVALPLIPYENKKTVMERGEKILNDLGLGHRINHLPSQMSGGEQQRVAIARALINNPKIIIGDEPTGNLDSKIRDEVMNIFKGLNKKGYTIILATHDPDVANATKRKMILRDGRVKEIVENYA